MSWYLFFVQSNPILSAVIQFAILGTLGEIFSRWFRDKKISMPFSPGILLWKVVEWSILAVCIKYAFIGFKGFVNHLVNEAYLPSLNLFTNAAAVSIFMNLQFGLFLVIAHRWLDNLPLKTKNWDNIEKSLFSLIWFWIPAHTITFMLPKDYQIGLAAIWSLALGIILGFYNRKKQ